MTDPESLSSLLEDFVMHARDLLVHADEAAQLNADGNAGSAEAVIVAARPLLEALAQEHRAISDAYNADT
ncbi:MAG: hypothetical protein M3P40_06645 [Actinomycetota bacterium]|nr:hypothetical protein [Actinomycetota bacterium]